MNHSRSFFAAVSRPGRALPMQWESVQGGADLQEASLRRDKKGEVYAHRERQVLQQKPSGGGAASILEADALSKEQQAAGNGSRADRLGLNFLQDLVSSRIVE